MTTVVVVQSGDLAAWVGALAGLAGVALGASIDSWRSRRAERKQIRRELLQAALEVRTASFTLVRSKQLAGAAAETDPAWIELIEARHDAMRAAIAKIKSRGIKEVSEAAAEIMRVALRCQQSGQPAVLTEHTAELQQTLDAFTAAVDRAKL